MYAKARIDVFFQTKFLDRFKIRCLIGKFTKQFEKREAKTAESKKSLIFSPPRNEIETMKMATAASSSALFACSKCFSRHPFEELSQGQQLCKVKRKNSCQNTKVNI